MLWSQQLWVEWEWVIVPVSCRSVDKPVGGLEAVRAWSLSGLQMITFGGGSESQASLCHLSPHISLSVLCLLEQKVQTVQKKSELNKTANILWNYSMQKIWILNILQWFCAPVLTWSPHPSTLYLDFFAASLSSKLYPPFLPAYFTITNHYPLLPPSIFPPPPTQHPDIVGVKPSLLWSPLVMCGCEHMLLMSCREKRTWPVLL